MKKHGEDGLIERVKRIYEESVIHIIMLDSSKMEQYKGFQKNRNFVLKVVAQKGRILKYCKGFQNDREIVLVAVKQNGSVIEYCKEMRNDREVVLAAIKQNVDAIDYTPLKCDTSFQFILQDPHHRKFIQDINIRDVMFMFY